MTIAPAIEAAGIDGARATCTIPVPSLSEGKGRGEGELKEYSRRRAVYFRGFTMIEAVLATVMVSVLLVVALNTVGASRGGQVRTSQQTIARMLAADLLSEIVQMPYADPNETSLLGLELSEVGKARSFFDDVDDYHALSESPPKLRDGTAMTEFSGYSRHVTVEYAQENDLTKTAALNSGVKRIRVEVRHGAKVLCRVSAVRTSAAPNPVTGALNAILQ